MNNSSYIKYRCITSKSGAYIRDSDIDYSKKYFSLSSIIGLQIVVLVDKINLIVNNPYSHNYYGLESTHEILPYIISESFINNQVGISADHCQSGKETEIYTIKIANIECGTHEGQTESSESSESSENREIGILYKNVLYKVPIHEDNTIGELKQLFLEELMNKGVGVSSSLNFNIRFIYGGKVITDDNIVLNTIVNPPYGITMQAMLNPKSGGNSQKQRKTQKQRKSRKQGKSRKVKR